MVKDWNDIKSEFQGADILLGNGFSIGNHKGFMYQSLCQEFKLDCSAEAAGLFDKFETDNFEKILDNLRITKSTAEVLKQSIEIDAVEEEVRTGLIDSINRIHPIISGTALININCLSRQLECFGDIYTTNYDVLLYYIILNDRNNIGDYFTNRINDHWVKYTGSDRKRERHIHYLHGSLFIFEEDEMAFKIIKDHNVPLLRTIIDYIKEENEYPLFVSEGSSLEKSKAIRRSPYLSFCYKRFEKSTQPLVVFGHSLNREQDGHIVDCVKHRSKVAISIYNSDHSKSDDALRQCAEYASKLISSNDIIFFDSSTLFEFNCMDNLKSKLMEHSDF